MRMTRGEWAIDFLHALGNDSPNASTINFVASWTLAENTRAQYNPLATTQPVEGSTCFNTPFCVRNYASHRIGIDATVKTIKNGRYPHILVGLQTNQPEKAANGVELGTWGTGLHGVALWRLGDHRNEKLLSHPDTAIPLLPSHEKPVPDAPKSDPPVPHIEATMTGDNEVFARDVQYIVLGGLMLAIAIVLAIKTYVPVQQTVKTIAAVAA